MIPDTDTMAIYEILSIAGLAFLIIIFDTAKWTKK
ncbi:hypothetical protein FV185_18530 [Ferrovum sp. PN-J185]|nr:hypothetical protein FV185_18530 [Ferrovum sp. PN-J185]